MKKWLILCLMTFLLVACGGSGVEESADSSDSAPTDSPALESVEEEDSAALDPADDSENSTVDADAADSEDSSLAVPAEQIETTDPDAAYPAEDTLADSDSAYEPYPAEGEPAPEPTSVPPPDPVSLSLMTHDSFEISEATLLAFERETGIIVEVLKMGDAGEMVNQAILSKGAPLADVLFGVDNAFLSRALDNGLFEAYASPELANIDPALQLDPDNYVSPVDYGDVCLNYDKAWFADSDLEPPASLDDLIDPAYTGLTVVENPATSSPGLAFLLATIVQYGEDGYLDYWEKLNTNEVLVQNGWSEAYYESFSKWGGDRPIVVSYASSPPAEVIFSEEPIDDAPTASVVADGTCFRQVEFAGILAGTEKSAESQQLIDFMLGLTFQEDIPLNMFVFPANTNAALPSEFKQYAALPDNPATLPPSEIAANREAWIEAWTNTVLR